MEIHYLDNAATTKPKFFAKDYNVWANSNTPYDLGLEANKTLDDCRNRIKSILGLKTGKVMFCRCATEAVQWLCGHNDCLRKRVCTLYEHDSVIDACNVVNSNVSDAKYVGAIDLYLHQYVNQITGQVFNIEDICKQVHKYDDGYCFFGSDLTAAIGHVDIPANLDTFCDALWFSGHKFHTEKGIGAIWVSDRLFDYLNGYEDSRNEYGLIHGTVNVAAAIAMTDALERACFYVKTQACSYMWGYSYVAKVQKLMDELRTTNNIEAIIDSFPNKTYAINAIILPGINADALQQFLSTRGVYIGVGHSACAGKADYRVLKAYGYTPEQASQTIRVSFDESTNYADIEALVNGIVEFKKKFM